MMRSDRKAPDRGRSSGGLLALFPLALVACAIAFLAFGAGRVGSDPGAKSRSSAIDQATIDSAAVEEAAAAAVVAISLARVAPALPEEALDDRKPVTAPATAAANQQDVRKPAPRREAAAQTGKPRDSTTVQPRGEPAQATQDTSASATKPEAKPAADNPGVLARIGAYAPSPGRIAGAVTDGVSKIASYIPRW